jgi:aerobic-type carbon monoxide dehydrogenase small subunit (CoxS/CutS family)
MKEQFRGYCRNGNICAAKKLLEKCSYASNYIANGDLFRYGCKIRHLKIAQRLI